MKCTKLISNVKNLSISQKKGLVKHFRSDKITTIGVNILQSGGDKTNGQFDRVSDGRAEL